MRRTTPHLAMLATLLLSALAPVEAQLASSCSPSDSAAATTIRQRLADWVAATNRGDRAAARDVWAPGIVGWFPSASLFSDSAAYAAAGLPFDRSAGPGAVSYEVRIDAVDVGGRIAAVHDVWIETRQLTTTGATVRRVLNGSELWRCSPDGKWRIARYVSAPEPWTVVR